MKLTPIMAGVIAASTSNVSGGVTFDPYWSNVELLLHFDESVGSTTFADSSKNAYTFTVAEGSVRAGNGNVKFGACALQSTASINSGGSVANSVGIVATGDFTIEGFYAYSNPSGFDALALGNESGGRISFLINSSGVPGYNPISQNTVNCNSTGVLFPFDGKYHHVAYCRSGTTLSVYIDGNLAGTAWLGGAVGNTNLIRIPIIYSGWVDEVRVTNGVCRYVAAFSPPTTPFPVGH